LHVAHWATIIYLEPLKPAAPKPPASTLASTMALLSINQEVVQVSSLANVWHSLLAGQVAQSSVASTDRGPDASCSAACQLASSRCFALLHLTSICSASSCCSISPWVIARNHRHLSQTYCQPSGHATTGRPKTPQIFVTKCNSIFAQHAYLIH